MNNVTEVIGTLIPIIITLGAFAMVILIRRMENAERLKMIEKGIDVSKLQRPKKPGGSIKIALVAAGVGLGLLAGNLLETFTRLNDEVAYFSMIFLFAGIGLLIGNSIVDKKIKEEEKEKSGS